MMIYRDIPRYTVIYPQIKCLILIVPVKLAILRYLHPPFMDKHQQLLCQGMPGATRPHVCIKQIQQRLMLYDAIFSSQFLRDYSMLNLFSIKSVQEMNQNDLGTGPPFRSDTCANKRVSFQT